MRTIYIPVTLAGATGSANSVYPLSGSVIALYVKYTTQPGTCIVAVTTKGTNAPAFPILTLSAANTNGWFFPRVQAVKNTDGSAITTWFDEPPVDDYLSVAVTVGTAGLVEVWLLISGE